MSFILCKKKLSNKIIILKDLSVRSTKPTGWRHRLRGFKNKSFKIESKLPYQANSCSGTLIQTRAEPWRSPPLSWPPARTTAYHWQQWTVNTGKKKSHLRQQIDTCRSQVNQKVCLHGGQSTAGRRCWTPCLSAECNLSRSACRIQWGCEKDTKKYVYFHIQSWKKNMKCFTILQKS